jgi:hypothetical protein
MCYGVVDGRCAGTTGDDAADGQTQQVPEPMTLSLFGVGILGAGLLRRRSKKRS